MNRAQYEMAGKLASFPRQGRFLVKGVIGPTSLANTAALKKSLEEEIKLNSGFALPESVEIVIP